MEELVPVIVLGIDPANTSGIDIKLNWLAIKKSVLLPSCLSKSKSRKIQKALYQRETLKHCLKQLLSEEQHQS